MRRDLISPFLFRFSSFSNNNMPPRKARRRANDDDDEYHPQQTTREKRPRLTKTPSVSDVPSGSSSSPQPKTSQKPSTKKAKLVTNGMNINTTFKVTDSKENSDELDPHASDHGHVLEHPDWFVGPTMPIAKKVWVIGSKNIMDHREITFVPALYKIIDEVMVIAADAKIHDPDMSTINIIATSESITVFYNAKSVPVVMDVRKIFGVVPKSLEDKDDQKKQAGGRDFHGAKLCNIFSEEFSIRIADNENKRVLTQAFQKNMSIALKPSITKYNGEEYYTEMTFKPDLKRFHLNEMDTDFLDLIKKRAYDLACCVDGTNVIFNGQPVPVSDLQSYCRLFSSASGATFIMDSDYTVNKWQVAMMVCKSRFAQTSFVNNVCTLDGGDHVDHVLDAIAQALLPHVAAKSKSASVIDIKAHMIVFVRLFTESPTFDSPMKTKLTMPSFQFGAKYIPSRQFIAKVLDAGLVESVVHSIEEKQAKKLSFAEAKKKNKSATVA
ncbi:histidine kinase-like ATPase [Gongronella butleri]|nr:histidine kinase-like ATPase [Gongronella butleri]